MKKTATLILTFLLMLPFISKGQASFSPSVTSGCTPLIAQFYNASHGTGTYAWTFGDGGTSTMCSPLHTFQTAGTYNVVLTFTNTEGTFTHTETITVYPTPTPSISGTDTICEMDSATYSAAGSGNTYHWSATGGSVYAGQGTSLASIHWTSYGNQLITLTETNSYGCSKSTQYNVYVAALPHLGNLCDPGRKGQTEPHNPKDSALLTIPDCVCKNSITKFNLSEIMGNHPEFTYIWSVSSGNIVAGQGTQQASVQWGSGPTITLQVIAINAAGCADTAICEFDVCPELNAEFSSDTACLGNITILDASMSDTQSQIVQYDWFFGNGNFDLNLANNNTTHTFATAGNHDVILHIKNADGCEDTIHHMVYVNPFAGPKIECPSTVCHGSTQWYSTTAYAGATYNWTPQGGTVIQYNPTQDSVQIQWGNGPNGYIQLEVIGGPFACTKGSIYVPIFPPSPNADYPNYLCEAEENYISVAHVPGTCYKWIITGGSYVPASQSNNDILLTPSAGSTSVTVTVQMDNEIACCFTDSTWTIPVRPKLKVYGNNDICEYSQETYTSNGPVSWTILGGIVISSSSTYVTVDWGQESGGLITATSLAPGTFCNNEVKVVVKLRAKPLPYAIEGYDRVCQNSTNAYNSNLPSSVDLSSWYTVPTIGVTFATSSSNPTNITFANTGVFDLNAIYSKKYFTPTAGWIKCYDTANKLVSVISDSIPTIYGLDTVCRGGTETYVIGSNPDSLFEWSVSGGIILSGQYTNTVDIQWGSASMGLITLSNALCGTNSTKNIVIKELPGVDIELLDSTCSGTSITVSGPAGFASYSWSPLGGTNQVATLTSTGVYTLTVSDGYCESTATKDFSTFPSRPNPTAVINVTQLNPTIYCPNIKTITASGGVSYSWSSTGGSLVTGTSTGPTIFDSTGTHTVTVTNAFGCTDTESVTISQNCKPSQGGPCKSRAIPNFSYNQCDKKFTNLSTNAVNYMWEFGDGAFSNQTNPYHQYSAIGVYNVTLIAWDVNGCPRKIVKQIKVNSILEAKVAMTPVACMCGTFNFSSAPSTQLSVNTVQYYWEFGDGNTSTVANPTHSYTGTGPYTVTLTIHDGICKDTFTYTHSFECTDPSIFTCGGCANQAIQFVDASTRLSTTTMWNWTFGDGNSSNLENPWHVYSAPGTYQVIMNFTDFYGCNYADTLSITVGTFSPGPIAYSVNGNTVTPVGNTIEICEGDVLIAAGPGTGYNYFWSNGDITQNTSITEPGVYSLVVVNNSNCYDSIGPFNVIVNPRPYATIIGDGTVCAQPTSALVATQGIGYTYLWKHSPFGGGTQYTQNLYNAGQSGLWEAVITNAYGCKDSTTHTVTVLPNPTVTFAPYNWQFCEGDSITVTVTSSYTSLIWEDGSTSPTRVFYFPGDYNVTVTDANGCSTTQSVYLKMNPKPDVSIVPFGCYKACDKVDVCGPVNANGSNLQYEWYDVATGLVVSTNSMYNLGSGSYYLYVKDLITGCENWSDTFSLDNITVPTADIAQGSSIGICTSGGSVTLDANNYDYQYNYTWCTGGVIIGTGQSIHVTAPGTYILKVGISECCQSTDTIIIIEEDCCWDSAVDFTYIPDGYTITSNEVWDGKYFVAGKVYIQNTAILDMTTIDVVFDEDGELIFEDQSMVRATNSVFRPCEFDKTWVGFTFKETSFGMVHTSTFKNAEIALNIVNYKDNSVKIADNTFTNCHIGVNIDKGNDVYTEGITGNSFLVDDDRLDFANNNYFGIKLNKVKMGQLISLNTFRYTHLDKDGKYFDGIYAKNSGSVISENKFTNMRRSIDLISVTSKSSIENNEIEVVQTAHNVAEQIRISDNELPILVFSNEIRNSVNVNSAIDAIVLNNVRNLEIKENHIKGFQEGIYGRSIFSTLITENEFDQCNRVGIYLWDVKRTDISCNVIRMKKINASTSSFLPYGILLFNGDNSDKIFTNCIFDCGISTMLFSSVSNTPIPLFKNNYLYNYHKVGLYNINHVGNVGSNSWNFVNAGRNTFTSNSHGSGSRDIVSLPNITEGGNYGVNITTGVNSVGSQNRFASTASCGHQILDPKRNKIDKLNVCDSYWQSKEHQKYDRDNKGERVVKDEYKDGILNVKHFVEDFSKAEFLSMVKFMVSDNKLNAAKVSIANAHNTELFKTNTLDLTLAECLIKSNKYTEAKTILSKVTASNTGETALRYILLTQINIATEGRYDLTDNEFTQLKIIDDERGTYANLARDMVHVYRGKHPFIAKKVKLDIELPKNGQKISRETEFAEVYPNPASNSLNLMFNVETEDALTINIFDLNGRIVQTRTVSGGAQVVKLNIAYLSAGSYIVSLKNNKGENKFNERFVKF